MFVIIIIIHRYIVGDNENERRMKRTGKCKNTLIQTRYERNGLLLL